MTRLEGLTATVTVYVRHRLTCRRRDTGEFYRGCDCPKWLRYSQAGRLCRVSAKTRSWTVAEEKREELQKQLEGGAKPTPIIVLNQPTIEAAVLRLITAKESEGVSHSTLRKLKYQLGVFERFMAGRSKFYPSQITVDDIVDYRGTWTSWGGLTRQKAQQNLRGFLKTCCKKNLTDLLGTLKPIKLSKADKERLQPQPFTEAELQKLLRQIPKTFSDELTIKRVTAFIHCAVATGLAIRDMIQLKKTDITDGWLRIKRQKTGRPVIQQLDKKLVTELMAVAYDTYIFWDGRGEVLSTVGYWHDDFLRPLMKAADLWIRGNLSHRFRDSFVDWQLGQGASMTDVAAMLGDTVAVCERHYADLQSKRMEERLTRLPKRSWD